MLTHNKKRILLVSHDLSLTGAPIVLFWLAKYLIKKDYIVDVVTYKNGMSYELHENYKSLGIKLKYIKNKPSHIKRFCSKNIKKYSLTICNTVVTYKFVKVAAEYEKPVIWYVHETKLLEDYINVFPDFAEVLVNFKDIYTVSEYAAKTIKKYNSNVNVIPNGIQDEFEKLYNSKNGCVSFGYIGSVNQLKGCHILIDSFVELVKKYPYIKLNIAGKCEDSDIIDSMQNCPNISLLGQVTDDYKKDFFNQTDILCVPSLDDPCPLSLLEGTMYGKAIITTNTTGNNYLVNSNESGFIIPCNDTKALYNAMEYFCLNPEKIETMQNKSREEYLKYGNIQEQEKKIDEMLRTFCV